MDVNAIIAAIGSVGFPIVACCALFYLYDKTISKLTSTLEKVDSTNERIATAIDKIFDRLERMENKINVKEDDGKRILGGLVDIWREPATEYRIVNGEQEEYIDKSKILPALFKYFGVDNVADLLEEVESITGNSLYAAGEDEMYDIIKLTLQTHVAADNSVIQ